jgi:hypothetical protein
MMPEAVHLAFVMPPVIDVIKRKHWTSSTKALCAFALCLITAAAKAYVAGDIDRASDLVAAGLVVFTGAQAMYHWFWKPSGISPTLEERTGLQQQRSRLERTPTRS